MDSHQWCCALRVVLHAQYAKLCKVLDSLVFMSDCHSKINFGMIPRLLLSASLLARGMYALGQAVVGEIPYLSDDKYDELLLAYSVVDGVTIAVIIGVLLTRELRPTIGQQIPSTTGQAFPRTPEELYRYVEASTPQQQQHLQNSILPA